MLIISGLVGPKARPFGVVDGQQVNIPVLLAIRLKLGVFCAGEVVQPIWGWCSELIQVIYS